MQKRADNARTFPHFCGENADECGQPKAETFSKFRVHIFGFDNADNCRHRADVSTNFHIFPMGSLLRADLKSPEDYTKTHSKNKLHCK